MASSTVTLLLIACFGLFVSPVLAFGAGEVPDSSPWDGYVWRHGDITKVLSVLPVSFVTKYAFTKMQVRQVYFGNWLRDYSQLLDTKLISEVHESVLRGIVSVLGFMEFGLATDEFDVTKERLGVYRHEHHIDNPFGYDTDLPGKDASKIDRRLRGPVRPEELEIDANTGMKNYIAKFGKRMDHCCGLRERAAARVHTTRTRRQHERGVHPSWCGYAHLGRLCCPQQLH